MNHRTLVVALCVSAFAPVSAAVQQEGWTVPRTPWGAPDLIGTYTNKTITPVLRPDDLADREFLTEDEIVSLEQERIARNERLLHAPAEKTTRGNNFWLDWGTKPTGRTSLIVDPPDGRLPALTPAYKAHADRRAEDRLTRGEADTWLDYQLNDRCIVWSAGPPMMPGPYNNTYMIFQTEDYVAIQVEMIHDTRIIPLDGRPHLDTGIRQYLGDMRGHWEGDTLVVETTNIQRTEGEPGVQGADVLEIRASNGLAEDTITITERFTRVSDDSIHYEFTVEDPSRWVEPYSGEFPFVKTDGDLYEYACHEGNYSMPGILGGERELERQGRR